MPPPRALPLRLLTSTVFLLTSLLRKVVGPKTSKMPMTSAEPCGAAAWTWLSPMTLLLTVPASKTLAPPSTVTFPAAELTSTLLPVMRTLLSVPPNSPAPDRPPASPDEPGSAVALTLLSLIASLLSVQGAGGQMSIFRPPASTKAGPTDVVTVAALSEIVLLLIAAESAPPLMWTPAEGTWPPKTKSLMTVALLFVTELLCIVKAPPAPVSVLKEIPAASAFTPCGETVT